MRKQNYNTKARRYILEYMYSEREKTVSASDIIAFLKSKGEKISFTTVYRCLNRLIEEKTVIKFTDKDSNKAVYQLKGKNSDCEEHLHIKCKICGKLVHIDCEFLKEFEEHIMAHHGFSLEYSGSILYGICDECKRGL